MGFFNKEKDFNKIKGENLIEWNEPNGEGCVVSDSNNFEEDNYTKPIYVKKQRKGKNKKRGLSPITIIFLCLFFALFAWSIWVAFLSSFVPRHRTWFKDYDSFIKKAGNTYLYSQLPESASDTKYYWGVDRFVTVAGYSTSLSDEDYEACKSDTIKQYQDEYIEMANTEWYLYLEDNDKEWVQEEWLDGYSIEETEELLCKNEYISDYYILAFRYSNKDGPISYFNCILCNDSSGRIIEVSCVDRTPTVREINK